MIKFVHGIRLVIDKRIKDAGIRYDTRPSFVILGDSTVKIDSLYKYKISDFKSIKVEFGLPDNIYGHTANFGVITLYKKDN